MVKTFQRQVFDMMDDALIKNNIGNSKIEKEKMFYKCSKGKFDFIISWYKKISNKSVFGENTLRAVCSEHISLQRFCKLCPYEEVFWTQSKSTHVGIERRRVDGSV